MSPALSTLHCRPRGSYNRKAVAMRGLTVSLAVSPVVVSRVRVRPDRRCPAPHEANFTYFT